MAKEVSSELLIKLKDLGANTISKTGDAIRLIGKGSLAAFALLSGAVTGSLTAYRKSELSLNSLNRSMISQGIYSKSLSLEYQKMAEQLDQTSGFADDDILRAQGQIQNYIGNQQITKRMMKAVLDFATATGQNLNSAASTLGKSIGSNTNLLSRYAIQIDVNADQATKTEEVISQLELKFGGQAEASIQGLGSLKKLEQAFEKLLRAFGKAIAPIVTQAAQSLTRLAEQLQTNDLFIQNVMSFAVGLFKTTTVLKSFLTASAKSLGIVYKLGSKAITLALDGHFKEAGQKLIRVKDDLAMVTMQTKLQTMQKLQELEDQTRAERDQSRERELEIHRHHAIEAARRNQKRIDEEKDLFVARDRQELDRQILFSKMRENEHLRNLNLKIQNEKDQTKKLELELEKKKYLNDKIYDMETRRSLVMSELIVEHGKSQSDSLEFLLSQYSQMQNSQYSELIAIGKAAAITAMTIAGARAVILTYEWVSLIPFIGPYVAPIMAALVAAWYLEQIGNIANSSLEKPGKISFGLNFGNLLDGVGFIVENYPRMVAEAFKKDTLLSNLVAEGLDTLADKLGAFGAPFAAISDVLKSVNKLVNFVGDIVGDVLDFIWPFAEGGLVTSESDQRQRVTPLKEVQSSLNTEIRVRVLGGLAGSEREAQYLASQIHQRLIAVGGLS